MWNFFKRVNDIFPFYLILIVNYPLILGLIINYNLITPRFFVINLLWLTFFVIIYRLFKNIIFYRIIVIICSFFTLIESLHWIIIKGPLSTSSLFVISATNFQESADFLSIKLNFSLLLLLPLFFLFYKAWKNIPLFKDYKYYKYIYFICFVTFSIFIIENKVNDRLLRKGTPNFIKVSLTFQQQLELFKKAKEGKSIKKVNASTSQKKQILVLILGESLNRNHMQLYGATKKTTPKLSQREDLLIFDNVVSSYSNTISSVLTSLSESALDNTISLEKSFDVFDIFKSAGYTNYWISNQSPIGVWENLVTVFARKADHPIFVNLASNNSMESTLTNSYDEFLFSPLKKVLNKNDSLKFIVIHTMGNHSSYKNRYPNDFNKFNGTNKKSQTIAEYHNSILYHDFVVDSLIKIINNETENAVVLYTADHGENIYDENNNLGHDYAGKLPKANVEIPFFIWTNRPSNFSRIDMTKFKANRTSLPYVTDNLFHSLIDLANIRTPLFDRTKSIINRKFNSKRKRILEDGKDYDQ